MSRAEHRTHFLVLLVPAPMLFPPHLRVLPSMMAFLSKSGSLGGGLLIRRLSRVPEFISQLNCLTPLKKKKKSP